MQIPMIYGLCFGGVALAGVAGYPWVVQWAERYLRRRTTQASEQFEELFLSHSPDRLALAYLLWPLGLAAALWLISGSWVGACVGVGVGLVMPKLQLARARQARWHRFHGQLIDGLLVLSSSLKAGLSMPQAFAVLVEEMPPPIAQEFGLVLKETQMGVSLEEALEHLRQRIPSDDVNLFITSVMVARESGGDVTRIFSRLVDTVRERRKIRERIRTLTFMARMQGGLMAGLPMIFGWLVYQMNPDYFRFFFVNPTGKFMLAIIVLLQALSAWLFLRFSRSPI